MAMKNRIEDSFEDRRTTLFLGTAAWIYFLYHFGVQRSAPRVLPVMKPIWYVLFFLIVLALQVAVWIYFKHFDEEKWNRKFVAISFFLCEWGVLMFTLALAFWPVFLVFRSKLI